MCGARVSHIHDFITWAHFFSERGAWAQRCLGITSAVSNGTTALLIGWDSNLDQLNGNTYILPSKLSLQPRSIKYFLVDVIKRVLALQGNFFLIKQRQRNRERKGKT